MIAKDVKRIAKVIGVLLAGTTSFFAILWFTGWVGLIAIFTTITGLLWFTGWWWERGLKRPPLSSKPFVSILIPAWQAEAHIRKTIASAKALRWPKKEIIVVNDGADSTANICRAMGVRCIRNKKRLGKALALNKAVKVSKGKFLFFLDSDTVVEPDCLEKLIPWLSDPGIAAVMPRYVAANRSFVARLVNIENSFRHSYFKSCMAFRSLISFRGCAVVFRKSTFLKFGGWPATLLEDVELSTRLVKKGYRIAYEPQAIVRTMEPSSFGQLGRQRYRWGKGAAFSWSRHKRFYVKNPQFLLNFLPYTLLLLAMLAFISLKLFYILPILAVYAMYTLSVKETLFIFSLFLLPLLSPLFTSLIAATTSHIAILSMPARRDLILIIPYTFIYLPLVMAFYIKGVIAGVRAKRAGRPELDLKNW